MLMSLGRKPTWRLHTELYKFALNVLANNSRTVYGTDLRLGKSYIFINLLKHLKFLASVIYFCDSVIYLFIFDGVTVKTGNILMVSLIYTH